MHLGLSKVAFIEGCPHVRGGLYEGCPQVRGVLYEGFHCTLNKFKYNTGSTLIHLLYTTEKSQGQIYNSHKGGGYFIVVVSWPCPTTPTFYCCCCFAKGGVLPSFENNRRIPPPPDPPVHGPGVLN